MLDDKEIGKEDLILKAATEEFTFKGFDGARTTTIAAKAGVTHAMLHYYFRTKEQLFERILMNEFEQLRNMMIAALSQPGKTLLERIEAGIRAHFNFINSHREVPMFVINAINRDPMYADMITSQSRDMISQFILPLKTEIDDAISSGEIRNVDVFALLLDMISLNVMPFVMFPLVSSAFGITDFDLFLENKREENVRVIMSQLKP